MKICLAQLDLAWEEPEVNQQTLVRLADEGELGDLLILPELWACGFTMNTAIYAQCNSVSRFLSNLAREKSIWIIAGIPEYSEERKIQENRLVLFNRQGQRIGHYAKRRLFTFAGEHRAYGEGAHHIIWNIEGLRVAPLICYELRFPELCREIAKDVDLFLFAANWPRTRQSHWDSLLPARAIENLAYVAAVNRVGHDDNNLEYVGHSGVFSPQGEILMSCGDTAGLFICEIDKAEVQQVRERLPFLDDMQTIG